MYVTLLSRGWLIFGIRHFLSLKIIFLISFRNQIPIIANKIKDTIIFSNLTDDLVSRMYVMNPILSVEKEKALQMITLPNIYHALNGAKGV